MVWPIEGFLTSDEVSQLQALLGSAAVPVTSDTASMDAAQTSIQTTLQTNMSNAFANADTMNNAMINYAMYTSRNRSLTDVANSLTQENTRNRNTIEAERDTTNRQVEINQWAFESKMETLFFLQLLFIFLCATAICLYLRQSLILSSSMSFILIGVLALVVVGVLLNRWLFTLRQRDKRYWNRKWIPADGNLSAAIKCPQ